MLGLHALRQLFNRAAASPDGASASLDELLGSGRVAVLSAACCDAMSLPRDEALAANLAAAMAGTTPERPVAFGTLTDTRRQLREAGPALGSVALDFRDQLSALFQTQGLAAFPLLLVDGRVAFYGGVPSVEAIAEKLRSTGTGAAT